MRYPQGSPPVPHRVVVRIAAEADVAEETVRRLIYGKPVRPRMARRIRDVMDRRGFSSVGLDTDRTNGAPPVAVPDDGQRAEPVGDALVPCGHLTRRVRDYRRKHRPGERGPRGIGMAALTPREREELAQDEAALRAAGVSLQRPRTVAECPPVDEPCPFVSCRHHLYLEVDPEHGFIKVNFPDRDVLDQEETCSLRVAARKPAGLYVEKGARPSSEVGRLLNITPERVNQIASLALAKVRAALEADAPASEAEQLASRTGQ
ncbi:MAG TPA: hypothetical protein VHO67_04770 [Polyangia bacterium]|nr:hypothetical protein [Polyangia bacterium]